MDALNERLAKLAEDAPTGGAPPEVLWARGRRAHRVRVAVLAVTLAVLGAAGTGLGVGLADDGGDRIDPAPAGTDEPSAEIGFTLPIAYPQGEDLPDLGRTPGPLAAVWVSAGDEEGMYATDDGEPEVVGLVAGTGAFGTLPIDVSVTAGDPFDTGLALSPDGRRIAAVPPGGELVVHDLVTGDSSEPVFEFDIRAGYAWIDATHLVGHVAGGSDVDGWVWEPGSPPRLTDLRTYPGSPFLGTNAGIDPWFVERFVGHTCQPAFRDREGPYFQLVLCSVAGVIGSEVVLTHDGNARVVAIDRPDAEYPFEDPAPPVDPPLRVVVETSGSGPLMRVRFATDLIGRALDAEGSAS